MAREYKKGHDWNKLQREFDLYKLKNRGKSLRDFCKLKKLNYSYASKKINVRKMEEKMQLYDREKAVAFSETLKKKAILTEKKKH